MQPNAPQEPNRYSNDSITLDEIQAAFGKDLPDDPSKWYVLDRESEPRTVEHLVDTIWDAIQGFGRPRFEVCLATGPAANLASRAGHSSFVVWLDGKIEYRFTALDCQVAVTRSLGLEQLAADQIDDALEAVESLLVSHLDMHGKAIKITAEEITEALESVREGIDAAERFRASVNNPTAWNLVGELDPAKIVGAWRDWRRG